MSGCGALLIDMDGAIYHGSKPLDGAMRFFEMLTGKNYPFLLITNNARNSPMQVSNGLKGMGINVPPTRIVTSGEVTLAIAFLTLTMLERMEKRFVYGKATSAMVTLTSDDPTAVIERINSFLLQNNIGMHKISVSEAGATRYEVRFVMCQRVANLNCDFAYVFATICSMPNALSVSIEEY